MDFIFGIAEFLLQAIILLGVFLIAVAGVLTLTQRKRGSGEEGRVEARSLNERLELHEDAVRAVADDPVELKARGKTQKRDKSEASRITARSVIKQIALLWDQTVDTFPWHRLDRATVLALMEKLKHKGLSDNTRNLYLSIIKGISREAMLHQQMSDHQFSLIEQIRAIKLQRLAAGRALHVDEIAKLIDHCLHDEGAAGVRDAALLGILFG